MLTTRLNERWQTAGAQAPGSRRLACIADENGTPFFLQDSRAIAARVDELRTWLPASLRLLYSLKANPLAAVVRHMVERADGFDVASQDELALALECGASGETLSMTGPGKTDADLAAAIACNALIVLESVDEARRLASLAGQGARPRVALRVNPPFELAAESRMGGGPHKFGVDSEVAGEALAMIGHLSLAFEGLHIYAGSNCLDAQAIVGAMHATLNLANDLAPLAPAPVRNLNLGGGFGIPCFPGEGPLSLEPLGQALEVLSSEARRRLPGAEMCIELGRYLVGEAGIYVARVLERKGSRGRTYLVLDGGLNHHWHATGALEGRRHLHYPMWVVGGADRPAETVTVTGPLCAPHDTWAENLTLPRAQPGDLVVVYQSGAYGAAASPAEFMMRRPAGQVFE